MGFKPSNEEQKWAKQIEMDLKKEMMKDLSDQEREELRELHWKKCPRDGIDLVQVEINNSNIMVDKCAICGGVWIDRTDLDKFLQQRNKPETFLLFLSQILGVKLPK